MSKPQPHRKPADLSRDHLPLRTSLCRQFMLVPLFYTVSVKLIIVGTISLLFGENDFTGENPAVQTVLFSFHSTICPKSLFIRLRLIPWAGVVKTGKISPFLCTFPFKKGTIPSAVKRSFLRLPSLTLTDRRFWGFLQMAFFYLPAAIMAV